MSGDYDPSSKVHGSLRSSGLAEGVATRTHAAGNTGEDPDRSARGSLDWSARTGLLKLMSMIEGLNRNPLPARKERISAGEVLPKAMEESGTDVEWFRFKAGQS